jgi:putative transposase
LWVAVFTHVSTWCALLKYASSVDVLSRYIVSRRVLNALRAERALNALEVALWTRQATDLGGLCAALQIIVG